MIQLKTPKTLLEAINYYSSEAVCVEFLSQLRWNGTEKCCESCGSTAVYGLRTRPVFKCRDCKKQFSIKRGTIMEDSPISITKWVPAMWMLVNDKNGISSCEIARALGVTQKTAWFMMHRIREALVPKTNAKLSGTVEMDETFVGGKEANKHKSKRLNKGTGWYGKTIVAGAREREGRVIAKVVDATTQPELIAFANEHIEKDSTLYSDDHGGYRNMQGYNHTRVNHTNGEYVQGDVHTNGIENFWSCFKRSVKGTYIQIASFHVDRYLDEQAYRYEHRKENDSERFVRVASMIFGKRLTYATLTGVAKK